MLISPFYITAQNGELLMSKKTGVPVSMRALIQRINRKLASDDEMLKTARSERIANDIGWYFIIDFRRNCIVNKDVSPEGVGRELNVLKAYEYVEAEN
jgi:hypothetical protein